LEANLPELPHEYVQIRRRYTHFREFYNKVVKLVGKEMLPEFPEKNFFGRYKTDVIEYRLERFKEVNSSKGFTENLVNGLCICRPSIKNFVSIF
jgi:hypothetical protein